MKNLSNFLKSFELNKLTPENFLFYILIFILVMMIIAFEKLTIASIVCYILPVSIIIAVGPKVHKYIFNRDKNSWITWFSQERKITYYILIIITVILFSILITDLTGTYKKIFEIPLSIYTFFEDHLFIMGLFIFWSLMYYKTERDENIILNTNYTFLFKKYYLSELTNRIIIGNAKKEINIKSEFKKLKNEKASAQTIFEQLEGKEKHIILSHSIYLYRPKQVVGMKISDVEFNNIGTQYFLPWTIASVAKENLFDRFYHKSGNNYNGTTLRIFNTSLNQDENKLVLHAQNSSYFNYLVTNMIPEVEVFPGTTVRDIIEPGKPGNRLNALSETTAENHLGLSCIITKKDGNDTNVFVGTRSRNVHVFKEQYSPSVSGAANNNTCKNDDTNEISALNFLINEMKEEVFYGCYPKEKKLFHDFIIKLCKSAKLLGMSRELIRMGKPEMFFSIELDEEDLKDFEKFVEETFKCYKYQNNHSLDTDENVNTQWIIINENLKTLEHRDNGVYYYKIDPETKKKSQVSESLLVNTIFYHEMKSLIAAK